MADDFESMVQEKAKLGDYFSENEIKLYTFQMLKGLEFIHSKSKFLPSENFLKKKFFLHRIKV